MATAILWRTGRAAALAATAAAAAKGEGGGRELFRPRLFEGDLVPAYGQILEAYGANVTRDLVDRGILSGPQDGASDADAADGGSLARKFRLWPSRLRSIEVDGDETTMKIPYEFSEGFSDPKDQVYVEAALAEFSQRTGVVRFVRRGDIRGGGDDPPYVLITSDAVTREQRESDVLVDEPSCWSYVGFHPHRRDGLGAGQPWNLGPGCLLLPEITHHLVMHALGVWHTSNRPDRDDYVTVLWDGVIDGLEFEFSKRLEDSATALGMPYDYASIMHFAADDLSNGKPSMEAPQPIGLLENGLSEGDLLHVRLLYQCASGPRDYSEYLADPCTAECPCWEGAPHSCVGDDDLCGGGLVCNEETDRCIRAAAVLGAASPVGSTAWKIRLPWHLVLWALLATAGLAVIFWTAILPCLKRRDKRREYMAVDVY